MITFLVTVAAVAVTCLVILALVRSVRIVPESFTMVIERLGRYRKTLKSGVNFILPFFDRPRMIAWDVSSKEKEDSKRITQWIDLREQIYDYPSQSAISKDNVTVGIDALLYFQIMDPQKAVYEVANLTKAIEMLTQTTLRNVVGSMELDQILTARDDINRQLTQTLDEATDKWGVKVNRVELKDIVVPPSIREQMEKQMSAEREKRAQVLLAQGEKEARILESEGYKESEINRAAGEKEAAILSAQGQAESIRLKAEAEAQAIEYVKAQFSGEKEYGEYLKAIRYIDAQKEMFSGKDVKTIFMPFEAERALAAAGAVGEMLREGAR